MLLAARCKYRTQKSRQKSPSGHHRITLSGYIFATKAHIDNRKKISSNVSYTCPHNMVNFGLLAAEIGPVVWGTPANFNGFRVLAALLHRATVQQWASAILCDVEQRAPPMFGRAAITLGIGPHLQFFSILILYGLCLKLHLFENRLFSTPSYHFTPCRQGTHKELFYICFERTNVHVCFFMCLADLTGRETDRRTSCYSTAPCICFACVAR